jgi:hypothetical protein
MQQARLFDSRSLEYVYEYRYEHYKRYFYLHRYFFRYGTSTRALAVIAQRSRVTDIQYMIR